MERQGLAIGIDIGATNLKAVCVGAAGDERGRWSGPTPQGRDELVELVGGAIVRLEGQSAAAPIDCLGISSPGLASSDGRSIVWMQGRMESVEGLDWTAALARRSPVQVLNDAHAATLGEAWLGAARGCGNVVLLTLGTGIGGGILVDGRLLGGHLGRAGHLGHLCLDIDGPPDICRVPGSLEEAVGECTLNRRSGGRFASTRELVEAVAGGDEEANRIWNRSLRALGCGIASIINAVDPETVVLGGGIAAAGALLFEPLAAVLDEVEWRPTGERVAVVAAQLGDFAGAIGAARRAFDAQ